MPSFSTVINASRILTVWQILKTILFLLLPVLFHSILKGTGILSIIANTDQIKNWVLDQGRWGVIAIIVLMTTAVVINPIPSAPITLSAGAVYGDTWGTAYVMVGATIGALAALALA